MGLCQVRGRRQSAVPSSKSQVILLHQIHSIGVSCRLNDIVNVLHLSGLSSLQFKLLGLARQSFLKIVVGWCRMIHLADSSKLQAFLQAVHRGLAANDSPVVQVVNLMSMSDRLL